MTKVFIATKNRKKEVELRRILEPFGFEVLTERDLDQPMPEVEETGTTFEENALLKANCGRQLTGLLTVADDSGICVEALGGAPGIYSARYSGMGDDANNAKLLAELKDVPTEKRTAYYVAAIACVFPDGRSFTVRGECHGRILEEPMGDCGFGYDPLFMTEKGCFGMLTDAQKDEISHRGRALRTFKQELEKYLQE
ncbi:MAG: RdgB/HAM1 family non-canonical purine NTP pyrophosphatase [Clostridia bacterium]|nr:RdgB/HAM1 family non-canonical purine NTP pyrophosphatase [Clostridia bacterium]